MISGDLRRSGGVDLREGVESSVPQDDALLNSTPTPTSMWEARPPVDATCYQAVGQEIGGAPCRVASSQLGLDARHVPLPFGQLGVVLRTFPSNLHPKPRPSSTPRCARLRRRGLSERGAMRHTVGQREMCTRRGTRAPRRVWPSSSAGPQVRSGEVSLALTDGSVQCNCCTAECKRK